VRKALQQTFREDYTVVNIFEESTGNATRSLGAGMAAFVTDDFIHEAKTTPSFWLGPELVKCMVSGKSPLLSEAKLREANAAGELSLIVWHNAVHPKDLRRMDVAVAVMTAFEETFRGFRMREIFVQLDSMEHLEGLRAAGGLYFDHTQGCYGPIPNINEINFSDEPRNAGITQELAMRVTGCTWRHPCSHMVLRNSVSTRANSDSCFLHLRTERLTKVSLRHWESPFPQ
jgi:hypothetical protein